MCEGRKREGDCSTRRKHPDRETGLKGLAGAWRWNPSLILTGQARRPSTLPTPPLTHGRREGGVREGRERMGREGRERTREEGKKGESGRDKGVNT